MSEFIYKQEKDEFISFLDAYKSIILGPESCSLWARSSLHRVARLLCEIEPGCGRLGIPISTNYM